jgi:hypothetical protein
VGEYVSRDGTLIVFDQLGDVLNWGEAMYEHFEGYGLLKLSTQPLRA